MKGIWLFIYCLGLSLFACNHSEPREKQLSVQDTVSVRVASYANEKDKKELLNTFYVKSGIVIPKYYLLEDSLAIDLNRDKLIDTLIVLSPVSLVDMKYSDCKIENIPSRILVEIINKGSYSKIRKVHHNLVSNIGGVLSKYNGLFATEKGFEIHHQSGSRYSWNYVTEFTTQHQDSIFLTRIEKTCSLEGRDKREEYLFNKKSLQEINVNDTIQNNCNCDVLWQSLESEYE